jgi:hypothetical protein
MKSPKNGPTAILLTEVLNRPGEPAMERKVGIPVSRIRKFVTQNATIWVGDEGRTPEMRAVVAIFTTDKNEPVIYVKESVDTILKMVNGEAV